MRKRITSLLLVLALCLTLLPASTLAAEAQGQAGQEQTALTQGNDGQTQAPGQNGTGEGDKTSDEVPDEAPDEEPDEAVSAVQALIDALPAAEDISDANADEVSGQLDAIDEAKLALTEEQAAQLDFAKYDAAAAAVLALAGEPDANEPAVLADTTGTQPSGSGTAKDPYQITGAAELIWLRDAVNAGEANTCAELQQDVEYVDEFWTPIGTSKYPYTGTFNGNGHTIRVWLHGWGQALFGYVGADAKLTDLAVTKRQSENYSLNTSAPLARSNAGTITRCRYSGGMTAKGSLGGLVYTNSGTIEACYVYAGQLNGGSRIEMYNGGWAGGITYENTGTIVNSYFYGDIVQAQSNGTVHDIIGRGAIAYNNSGTVSNCYYGADRDDGYGGKTEDQFRGGEVAYLLNGGTARDDWRQNCYAGDNSDATPVLDRSHAQVRKTGSSYVSLYPHVHCICGGDATSGGHPQHSDVTYTAWTNDEAASQYGDSSHTAANSLPKDPGYYYLTTSVTLSDSDTWRPADGTVLCLNGRTVREFAFYKPDFDAITVDSGVTFSLTECASIQGYIYCAGSRAVHTVNNSGTFNMYNGRLRGTTSTADGAAVCNNGTFNMYGGTISNNGTTARGGGVYNAGVCNLYGGLITNNGAGGGVYNNGTLTVGGTATVTGGRPNVYLAAGKTIKLNSALDESARIGITAEMQSSLADTAAITVVEGGAASLVCFFPDDDGTYDLSFNDDDDVLLHLIRDHTHCACGHKGKYARSIGDHTEHVDREFVAWTDELVKEQYGSNTTYKAADTLPKAAGYYYLTSDVDLGAYPWAPKNGTILCLNGHKITSSWSTTVRIDSDAHIVLTDCRASGSIRNTKTSGAALKSSGSSISRNGIADIFRISLSGTSVGVENYTSNTVNLYNSTVSGTRSAIYNTGTVNIAGTVKAASDAVDSGRYCVNNLGTLTVDGTLTADGGNIGVANRVEDSRSGTITVNGTLICTGDSDGLSNRGTATVAGTLTATGKRNDGVYNYGGTLTVNGTLTATGNASGKQTDGLDNSNNGTVTINGTLTASGGQFSVYNYGTLNLSGTVNATKNVFLGTGRTITVVGELDDATSIPIQTAATPEAGSPVTIATTENADWIKEGSFVSWTPGKYAVSRIDEGKTVVLRGHEHAWSYTLGSDGTAISAECGNADGLCGNTNGGSVTIAPPSGGLIYDGSAKAATVTETKWAADDVSAITYKQGEKILSSAPTDVGEYAASITVGGVTASVTYEIGKATPMAKDFVFAAPGNLNYDGNSKIVTVSSTKISMDDVTVKYYDKDGEEAEPKNAGDYIVKIDVAESTNYAAVNDLMADGWKFTIAKNTTTPDVTLSGDMVYKKNKIEPTVTVTVDGKTLTKDKDYEVTYGDNMNAGKNAGTVTITAKGNYDFAQIVKMFDITAQIIQVTAENKSSRVGQDIVELTYTHADGLPYEGDTFSGKLETTADKDKAGTYGITQGTLTLGSNYNIVFTPGTYTVEDKLPQDSFAFKDVVDGKVTKTYGDADFTVAATDEAEGSSVSYESTNTNVATVDSTGKVTIHAAGTTTIKATAHETKDYTEKEISYTLTVAPKTLTKDDLTYSGPITKVYDGSNSAPSDLTVFVKPTSLVGSDTLTITGSAKYNSKDVKDADTITFTPNAITEGNYRLAAAEKVTVTKGVKINRRTITIASVQATSKQYDGDTTAYSCITSVTFNGLVEGETLTKSGLQNGTYVTGDYGINSANFNSANVNEASKITGEVGITNPNLNYTFKESGKETSTAPFTTTGSITPANSWSLTPVTDLTIRYNNRDLRTYTPNWSTLLPSGQTWTYSASTATTGSAALSTNTIGADTGVLSYQLSAGNVSDTATWTVTASCANYQSFTLAVTLTLIARDEQTGFKFENNTTSVTKTYGDEDFTIAASGGATGSSVTYTSSDETVAKVDEDGKVTIVGAGITTIKAKASETADFEEKEISYTLTVKPKTLAKDDLTYSGSITKVYDGSTNAPSGLTVSVDPSSLVNGDTLTVNGTLKFNSANVGEASEITFIPTAITTGNYTLAATEALTIRSASITAKEVTLTSGINATNRSYAKDNKTVALTKGTLAFTGLVSGETLDVNIPDTGTIFDTKVGTYNVTYSGVTLKDGTTGKASNYKLVGSLPTVTVTISKAAAPVLADIPVSFKYTVTTGEKAIGNAGIPADAGTLTYSKGTATKTGTVTVTSWDVDSTTGKVTYTLSGGKAGDSATLFVTIASTNYEDATVNVVITLTARDNQVELRITGGTTVVYGQTLALNTSGGSGSGAVTYTVVNATGEATIDPNTGILTPVKVGSVSVIATKAGDNDYNAVTSAPVEITITKATPTGEPKYTEIKTGGKTLADAALTIEGSTLKPNAGTLEWVDDKGNVLSNDTKVEANTTYKWRFTPTDGNYTVLTGSIELYHKSSSGGSGWYYTYYTIKATAGTNGSISPSGWTSVRDGRDQTFTITPDKGYAVAKVLVDGKSVGAVKSYTFKNVTKDHTIEAIFMKSNGNPQTGVFVDVAEGSYYEEAIDWAVEKGITNGVSSNMFAPNDPCTRAQIVTFLWRAAGSPAPKSMSSFTDVPADAFYAKAVAWAVENGITSGTGESKFSPNSTCTRAQAVTFLYRASGSPAVSGKAEFSDVSTTAFYADAVAWAAKKGITTGIGGGLFGSDNDCTRGQIVTFLWRAMAE